MDFRKFGIVIVVLGMLIAVYGGVQLAMNQPVEPTLSGKSGVEGWLKDTGRRANAFSENRAREPRRGSAVKVILVGGLILILGFGIRASAKENSVPARS